MLKTPVIRLLLSQVADGDDALSNGGGLEGEGGQEGGEGELKPLACPPRAVCLQAINSGGGGVLSANVRVKWIPFQISSSLRIT
ncbi:MAG: hypothetical protein M2R46_05332 [Verrucomicrobia subdivision 3 bacterium]|nr:hypothetical protein [Limisphaerales bacterium]